MADLICKNCGEPWDYYEVKTFTEEEKEMFFSGKGCPSCEGKPTYYCQHCDKTFEWWRKDYMTEEQVKTVWEQHKCPYCGSQLKRIRFNDEYYSSLAENIE